MTALLLLPTWFEASLLPDPPAFDALREGAVPWRGFRLGLCGMGPVDAAAGASWLLGRDAYASCLLVGLCGAYEERLVPGRSLVELEAFELDGFGVWDGQGTSPPEVIAFPDDVRGVLPLESREVASETLVGGGLEVVTALTVSASSANEEAASLRKRHHPEVAVEEMEGFGVARACRLHGVPFACVRAVSNYAGDRDHGRWKVDEARALLLGFLADKDGGSL